jgi:hypothetical protein
LISVLGGNPALTFRLAPRGAEYRGTTLTPLERRHAGEIPVCRFAGVADITEKDHWNRPAHVAGQALIVVPI